MLYNPEKFTDIKRIGSNPKELINYQYLSTKDGCERLVIFESGSDLIECIRENGAAGYYEGSETSYKATEADRREVDTHVFGTDFPSLHLTDEALERGQTAQKYMDGIEAARQELFKKFPKLEKMQAISSTKKRRRVFTEVGDEVDIDRYMTGDSNCFSKMTRQQIKGKVCRIYIDCGISGGVNAGVLTRNMLNAVAVCQILERAGVALEIICGDACHKSHADENLFSVLVTAKRADEPMDLNRILTFALPGLLRYYTFLLIENVRTSSTNYGLGKPITSMSELENVKEIMGADIAMRGANLGDDQAMKVLINDVSKFLNIKDND